MAGYQNLFTLLLVQKHCWLDRIATEQMGFFKIFLISIFSDMGAIQLLFPFLAEIYFQKIVTLVPLIGLISDKYLIDNLRNPLSSRQGKALIFLVLWMIMSVPLSIYPGWSFAFLTQNFWKILVMVLLVLAYGSSKESLNKIIWAYILARGILKIFT